MVVAALRPRSVVGLLPENGGAVLPGFCLGQFALVRLRNAGLAFPFALQLALGLGALSFLTGLFFLTFSEGCASSW